MIQTREISPTGGNGFSTSGIHAMQERDPGGKPIAHRVRAYTDAERRIVTADVKPGDHEGRFVRLVMTDLIDRGRFEDAGISAPWTTEGNSNTGIDSWAEYYAEVYEVKAGAAIEEARARVAAIHAAAEVSDLQAIGDLQAHFANSRP